MTEHRPAAFNEEAYEEIKRRRGVQSEHADARRPGHGPNYVSAADLGITQKPAVLRIGSQAPAPAQPVDLSQAWQPMTSPGRDSVSAVDRAKAFHIRSIPIYAAVVGMAVAAVILYSVTVTFWGVHIDVPMFADRILIFLAVTFGWGLWMFKQANETDYDHSHAGIERLRILEAAEIQRTIVEAEAEIKREALQAYLRLLEGRGQ